MLAVDDDVSMLVFESQGVFDEICRGRDPIGTVSKRTKVDYAKVTWGLVNRATQSGMRLMDVVLTTSRSSTYHKRMAAVRYLLATQHRKLMSEEEFRRRAGGQLDSHQISSWQGHRDLLIQYREQQKRGFTSTRSKRISKRKALRGLPADWRQQICQRARNGKYGLAMLVAALTGCRPAELAFGVVVWRERYPEDQIVFRVKGAKVNDRQGQPYRLIAYRANDSHPLVQAITGELDASGSAAPVTVQIEHVGNFTVEIRRLAECLWPKHPHAVTAYCFRHQWAADMKRTHAGDVVSQGLGHVSAKTRRYYGQARQATGDALRPVAIAGVRPIKGATSEFQMEHARDLGKQDLSRMGSGG
ncbi:site-specific integrase [Castellaniella sp. FW104-16D08]|uniref:site-specific integrase n=1 Tax=unclassified Castellaniella TaxID=2617606 RepID=UPI003315B0B4